MNIFQAQRKAQRQGFDSAEFVAFFPAGPRKCKWLDAYLGLFSMDGADGFLMVGDVDDQFPELMVLPLGDNEATP